ncbi:TPA: BspA family leucine-rich repeat surface protein, partial [Enterococcus faecalis]|nr:BspA family leucine-rich repeat surface protein [Enterococcus faecalis]EJW9249074.1 BspA family leucine-rich repeat surface protein [Enterococcus faecalis]HBI1773129.1 BspA family leucine-rich repeat surface protein [Enterococcus faecalis]HBI1794814.1 BspA family leucine-rich repeat surface protein [Enterococcus faecalis]HBI1800667.1 BspA family leucine-rich repeat surface protein [Enterococcus faecalis]
MSKKKLTKKKKKQLLALFATTTMTVNMVMVPLSVLAEQNETSDADSVGNVLEENVNLPAETMTSDADGEKESIDIEDKEVEASKTITGEKEVTDEQKTEGEAKVGTLTGSYENDGTWTFNQENGLLVLSGGILSASIGADSWLKEIKKADVLEIQVVNAVGAEDLSALFDGYLKTKNITFEQFDTSDVTNMSKMFRSCSGLKEVNLSGFDTSKVEDMSSMFEFAGYGGGEPTSLSKITFGNIDTSQVTNMSSMFKGCRYLTELDINNIDTSQVTNMSSMFEGCRYLTELDINNIDTSQVTDMSSMFLDCKSLTELNVSNIDTSQVTNMRSTFSSCNSLTEINLKNFDTSQVTDMGDMFYDCSSLKKLDLSSFDTSNVTSMGGMFGTPNNGRRKISKLTLGSATKIMENSRLGELQENTFWYGEYAGNLLDATDELIEYHNALNEINTYTIINKGEKSLALTFDTVGGSEISPIETKFGGTWVAPTAPIKEGYIFEGWYTDADYTKEFDFDRVAIEPLTVYAKWAEEKEEPIFEVDDYHIGDYNITGRFSAPIVTAQLRINGSISNKGGTFNQNDGTFYYY